MLLTPWRRCSPGSLDSASSTSVRMPRATYRLWQFWSSIADQLTQEDVEWTRSHLSSSEMKLFLRMPLYDQTHSLRVAQQLEALGEELYVVQAALLHDCGKTLTEHRVPLIYRGIVVVLRALSPKLLQAAARPLPVLWPVYLHVNHPRLGAKECRCAGASSQVVEIVARHQDRTGDPLLLRFQEVDNRN